MFGNLTEKFRDLFAGITGKKELTESNIADAAVQVRQALLDADVNYEVVETFVARVKQKALGESVIKSVSPGEQFTKVVHDELVLLMGSEEVPVEFKVPLTTILMCGLQGSGKTTHSAKLAHFFGKTKKVLVAACDLQRPAAIEQLKTLCAQTNAPVFYIEGEQDPIKVAKAAAAKAKTEKFDLLIIDTAGRLHLDEELMTQLEKIKEVTNPDEVLFVANGTTGQDAVRVAAEFDKRVSITGTILTMLDGTSRAGAAISIREVTKKPLKFEGIGEKISDLQIFNPRSMADRILGMGDVINLVKKAKEQFDEAATKKIEEKIRKASFTYEDYLSQMGMMKKMGPLKGLLQMLPGVGNLPNLDESEGQMKKVEAIILSMTPKERRCEVELDSRRQWRITKGSGTKINDIKRLMNGFEMMKNLMKNKDKLKKLENTWL